MAILGLLGAKSGISKKDIFCRNSIHFESFKWPLGQDVAGVHDFVGLVLENLIRSLRREELMGTSQEIVPNLFANGSLEALVIGANKVRTSSFFSCPLLCKSLQLEIVDFEKFKSSSFLWRRCLRQLRFSFAIGGWGFFCSSRVRTRLHSHRLRRGCW